MIIQDWGTITVQALQNALQGFFNFIPSLLGAIIVFVIGWFIAIIIGKIVAEVLARLTLNKIFERTGWQEALQKAEIKVNPSDFIGAIIKWILVIVFLLAAVEILGFPEFAGFLRSVLSWLPNLLVAVGIFVVAVILADISEKLVRVSVKKIGIDYVGFLGAAVKWAIYIFALLAILVQIGVAPSIINTLLVGFVATIALSFGLAFGLGGRDAAAKIIEDIRRKISEK